MNRYQYPFTGYHPVTSPYGPRSGGFHAGTDFGWNVDEGQSFPVCASAPGRVVYYADEGQGGGRTMTVAHDGGEQTRYYHLDHPVEGVGADVARGQVIAMSGATGGVAPHLHFQIHTASGATVDPMAVLVPWDESPEPVPAPPWQDDNTEGTDMYWMRGDDGRMGAVFEDRVDVFNPNTYGPPAGASILGVGNDVFNYIVQSRGAGKSATASAHGQESDRA